MTSSNDSRGVRWLGLSACTALVGVVSLVTGARPAQSGINVWTTDGPYRGSVAALAIDPSTPSTLYAGSDAGAFDTELTCVVGSGTGASCTELALDACLPGGASFNGALTFNCGGAATITVTSPKTISADTTIDGGSLITISGGHSVGVFSVNTGVKFTVHNLTIAHGYSECEGQSGGIANFGTVTLVTQ